MRVAVVGTGAVGAYFGGTLTKAGEDVTFIARGAHLSATRESGLHVESPDGDIVINPVSVTDDTMAVGPVDVVLLAVKGWQLRGSIETMRPLIAADTVVIPLLNGVDAPDLLAAELSESHAAGGLCGLYGSALSPGHFQNVLPKPFITFGELDNRMSDRMEGLRRAFERAGVQASIAEDIRAALWEKLLFVGPFGGIGAVTRAQVGVIRSVPETRAVLESAMNEILQVAQALGVEMRPGAFERAAALIDGSPERAIASMQRDIVAGRPSELESQIGVVIRLAGTVDVQVPIHSYLYAVLLPQELQARGGTSIASS